VHKAADRGDVRVLQLLLDSGLHPDVCSESPASDNRAALSYASTAAAAALLLERGADPLRTDCNGMNCLHLAASVSAQLDVLQALLRGGADPTLVAQVKNPNSSSFSVLAITPALVASSRGNAAAEALLARAEQQWRAAAAAADADAAAAVPCSQQ
jgi:ankyrin repeat protein